MKPVSLEGLLVPVCPYCEVLARLVAFEHGERWECPTEGCGARIGIHRNSRRKAPLGTMARAPLRAWRLRTHDAFDPLWKGPEPRFPSRSRAYAWLAAQLGISVSRCHIGEFDEVRCREALGAIAHFAGVPR